MSALWRETTEDWANVELVASAAYRLSQGPEALVKPFDPASLMSLGADDIVLRKIDERGTQWALMCRPYACRVNTEPVSTGFRCLAHKDEIILPQSATRLLYSTESIATIVTHTGDPIVCPRCTSKIVEGMLKVVCVNCGVAHHQSDERPCWLYSDACTVCQNSTSLDAAYSWPPEGW